MTVKRKRMLYVGGILGVAATCWFWGPKLGEGSLQSQHLKQRRVHDEPQSVRSEMSVTFHVILGEEPCVFVRY